MAAIADVAHPLSYPALAPRFVNVTKPKILWLLEKVSSFGSRGARRKTSGTRR
jgi:hypothetical protein